jgi:hypothetical protein
MALRNWSIPSTDGGNQRRQRAIREKVGMEQGESPSHRNCPEQCSDNVEDKVEEGGFHVRWSRLAAASWDGSPTRVSPVALGGDGRFNAVREVQDDLGGDGILAAAFARVGISRSCRGWLPWKAGSGFTGRESLLHWGVGPQRRPWVRGGRISTLLPHGTGWRRPRRRSEAFPMATRTSPPRKPSQKGRVEMRPQPWKP